MTIAKWPFNETDKAMFADIEKKSFQADRMVAGFPTASFYREQFDGSDKISGTQGTRNVLPLFTNKEVMHMAVEVERIQSSGGVYQAGAIDLVVYETVGELPLNTLIKLSDGRYYRIQTKQYYAYSDRHELVCNPYSGDINV